METPSVIIETLVNQIESYGNTSLEITKLRGVHLGTRVIAYLIVLFIALLLISVSFIALNLGIALYINEYFEKLYSGFFILAGVYLSIGLCYHYFLADRIKMVIQNRIISKIFQKL